MSGRFSYVMVVCGFKIYFSVDYTTPYWSVKEELFLITSFYDTPPDGSEIILEVAYKFL